MMDEHAVLGAVHIDHGAIGRLANDVAVAVLRFDTAGRPRMTDEGSRLNRTPRRLVADERCNASSQRQWCRVSGSCVPRLPRLFDRSQQIVAKSVPQEAASSYVSSTTIECARWLTY